VPALALGLTEDVASHWSRGSREVGRGTGTQGREADGALATNAADVLVRQQRHGLLSHELVAHRRIDLLGLLLAALLLVVLLLLALAVAAFARAVVLVGRAAAAADATGGRTLDGVGLPVVVVACGARVERAATGRRAEQILEHVGLALALHQLADVGRGAASRWMLGLGAVAIGLARLSQLQERVGALEGREDVLRAHGRSRRALVGRHRRLCEAADNVGHDAVDIDRVLTRQRARDGLGAALGLRTSKEVRVGNVGVLDLVDALAALAQRMCELGARLAFRVLLECLLLLFEASLLLLVVRNIEFDCRLSRGNTTTKSARARDRDRDRMVSRTR